MSFTSNFKSFFHLHQNGGGKKAFSIFFRNDKLNLLMIITAFTAIFSYFSFLRYEDFFTTNWDLGINMQLLWSTTHGYLMFEAGDFVFVGVRSFLQIHSTYIAYPIALIYDAFPSALLLFILQSFVISLSIVPLYLMGKHLDLDRKVLFPALLVYLLNFGLISGLLYDFHWETFLPLEFFTMFYLMLKKKYLISLIPFIIGCCTLEVFPLLTAGGLMYFIYEWIPRPITTNYKTRSYVEIYQLASYLIVTIVAYGLIRFLQLEIIPKIVGTEVNVSAIGYSFTSLLSVNSNLDLMAHSLLYWLLLLVAMGYISLLHPRFIIIASPWLFFTFLIDPSFASYFGNQYAIITLIPITIGFIFGLSQLTKLHIRHGERFIFLIVIGVAAIFLFFTLIKDGPRFILGYNNSLTTLISDIILSIPVFLILILKIRNRYLNYSDRKDCRGLSSVSSHKDKSLNGIIILFVLLMIANLMMSPLNTANFNATPMPGYLFQYSSNPEFHYMKFVLSRIDSNQTIVASDNLFPFVANNPNAYSIAWFPYNTDVEPYFPFSPTNLPKFVLVDSSQIFLMPPFLSRMVFNRTYYTLIVFINFNEYPGSVYLFGAHTPSSTAYYNVSKPQRDLFFYSKNLAIGASGKIVKYNGSRFGTVIESSPAANLSGNGANIWYGPYVTLYPGAYKAIISLRGGAYTQNHHPVPILFMNSNGYGSPTYYQTTIYSNQLSSNRWTNFTFYFNVTEPYPLTEFRGYIYYFENKALGFVILNYIEVEALPMNS
jgi:uncharacterized membrane protein